MHLVFWQPIPSFHQEGFLSALAQADWVDSVTLKYEFELPADRRQSGWRDAAFFGVKIEQIQVGEIPVDTGTHIHIFTGFQTHPMIWSAFHRLPKAAQCRRYAFAEAPECIGWKGVFRRLKYNVASWKIAPRLDGVLALGQLGVDFYRSVLPHAVPVHQFAYYDVSLSVFPRLESLPKATVGKPSTPLHFDSLQLPTSNSANVEQETPNIECRTRNQEREARNSGVATNQPTTTYNFLYVGQLIKRKGVDRLLHALARLPESENTWTLDLVGGGAQKDALLELSTRLGIAGKLQWHGSIPSEQLSAYYQQADCLVLPSRWDGWGMTVNEALRYGCDVLATVTCGAASALPLAAQLPKKTDVWGDYFEAEINKGALEASARITNQELAKSLSGEAGVDALKRVLLHT